MSDVVGAANELVDLHMSAKLALAAREAQKGIQTSPTCLECGENTQNGARWCDSTCRDLYVKRK